MRKITCAWLLSLLGLSVNTWANCCPDTNIQLGASYTQLYFKVEGGASFNGGLGGLQGLYERCPLNDLYLGTKLSWLQGTTYGSSGSRATNYVDAEERAGYTFAFFCNKTTVSVYTGLGFHHLWQKLRPSTGTDPLDFNYNTFYVPAGFKLRDKLNSCVTCGLNFAWMPQMFSITGITPLTGAYWTLRNTYTNFLIELPFEFSILDWRCLTIILTPYYQHWEDGHSFARTNTGLTLGLPGNSYDFCGINLDFSYRF